MRLAGFKDEGDWKPGLGSCPIRFEGDEGWVEAGDYGKIEVSNPKLLEGAEYDAQMQGTDPIKHVRNFLDSVKSRKPATCNSTVARYGHVAGHAAAISWKLGRKIELRSENRALRRRRPGKPHAKPGPPRPMERVATERPQPKRHERIIRPRCSEFRRRHLRKSHGLRRTRCCRHRQGRPPIASLLADEKLHDYARDGLERINDPAASKALLDSLKTLEGSLRTGVIITLGDLGDAAAVPALAEIAKEGGGDKHATAAALSSLGKIATQESAKAILTTLASGDDNAKNAASHAALTAAQKMEKAGQKDAAAKLRKAVAEAEPVARVE